MAQLDGGEVILFRLQQVAQQVVHLHQHPFA